MKIFNVTSILVIIFLILLSGCGEWPDVVENKYDIDNLSKDTTAIRARFLSDQDVKYLARFDNLINIDFGSGAGDSAITDEGIKILAHLNLNHLITINLSYNNNITNQSLKYIASIKSVEELLLSECNNITDKGIYYIQDLPNLRYLDVSGCDGISEKAIRSLSQKNTIHIRAE